MTMPITAEGWRDFLLAYAKIIHARVRGEFEDMHLEDALHELLGLPAPVRFDPNEPEANKAKGD